MAVVAAEKLRFPATGHAGEVSALLLLPPGARCLLVLGHGAGAGRTHPFMEDITERLARLADAVLSWQAEL